MWWQRSIWRKLSFLKISSSYLKMWHGCLYQELSKISRNYHVKFFSVGTSDAFTEIDPFWCLGCIFVFVFVFNTGHNSFQNVVIYSWWWQLGFCLFEHVATKFTQNSKDYFDKDSSYIYGFLENFYMYIFPFLDFILVMLKGYSWIYAEK